MNESIGALFAAKLMNDMAASNKSKCDLSLEALVASYNKPESFRRGDHVEWKDRLANKSLPRAGERAIVIEVLDPPIVESTQKTGSSYYGEKLDVRLAVKDRDGGMRIYLYDGNRFKLAKRYLGEDDI